MKILKRLGWLLLLLFGIGGLVSGIEDKNPGNVILGFVIVLAVVSILLARWQSAHPSKAKKQNEKPEGIQTSPNSAGVAVSDGDFVDVGVYEPTYVFSTVDGYKDRLTEIRAKQKQMVKDKTACSWPTNFTMNGSQAEGKRVVNDWMSLMLRAFNGESDVVIDHATYLNYNRSIEKIQKSADSINKIGARMNVQISQEYVNLKLQELAVAFDYQQFKEAEKERLRQIREEEREKAKVEKELAERRSKIEKDQNHVSAELDALNARLANADSAEEGAIRERIIELEAHKVKLEQDLQDVENRTQQARAGYVYIISNIGSFGENVYKIGMTRRLDPQDRVDELGSASVPFRFDVHAFIFSEDAVQLETALHHAFENRRVNMVNTHKEFFRVTLDEIEACVKKNYSKTVEFTKTATAQEYRETVELLKRASAA